MAKRKITTQRGKSKDKPSAEGKKRAAVYLRMSTDDQDMSMDNQNRAVANLAKQEYQKVVEYSDPGKSASKRKVRRPELERMLADAAAGNFDVIVTYDLSRFTRLDILDAGPALNGLRDAGVVIHTIAEGKLNMSKEFDRLKLSFLIEHANREAKSTARRSLDGRANKVKRGGPAGSKTPYGMAREVTPEKGKPTKHARCDVWNPGR